MQAVFRLSRERGFAAMGMRDLSRASGISLGGLYTWVSNKQQLAELALAHTRRIVLHGLLQRLPDELSPEQALLGFVRGHLFLSERFREWFYFSYMEARAFSGVSRERALDIQSEARAWLDEVLRRGEQEHTWQAHDMRLLADLIRAMLQHWYVSRGQFRSRGVGVEAYCRACEQAVLRLTGGNHD
jgi:AcrR family transcriptional regulator